jgi:hypothetical protein
MRFLPKPRASLAKEALQPPKNVSLQELEKPLDFWYIKSHDRKTLTEYIMPYMAGQLSKQCILQTVVGGQAWARELVKLEHTEAVGVDIACLQQTTAAFWKSPTTMIVDLLLLTRLWFFALLRYTYRTRFLERHKISESDFEVRNICICRKETFFSELTKDTIYRLTCVQNKYGASFYRSSYKEAKHRLGWTSYCATIRTLCRSIGLYTSSDNPEKNLRELRYNLTSIMIYRKWSQIHSQLDKTTLLARHTRRDMKNLDEQVTAGIVNNLKVIDETRQENSELQLQFDEFRHAYPPPSELQQWDTKLSAGLEQCRLTSEKELQKLHCSIQENKAASQQLITDLKGQIEELRADLDRLHTQEERSLAADVLMICRWLLENLPSPDTKYKGFGYRWGQFWQSQWSQCKNNTKRKDHPLQGLPRDEMYNDIGKNLYSTLSERVHGYGDQRGEKLHPDVLKVLDVIRPVHFKDDGAINLKAEKKRWLK